jgi:hypothetical protein
VAPKVWIVLGHLATLGAWLYLRRLAPPLERFTLSNMFAIASLTTAAGLLGPRAFHLLVLALPFVYNLVRYYPELQAYSATPRGEREGAQSKASWMYQRVIEAAAVLAWVAVMVFALQRELLPESRHWFFLSVFPGLVGVSVVASEVIQRWRGRRR